MVNTAQRLRERLLKRGLRLPLFGRVGVVEAVTASIIAVFLILFVDRRNPDLAGLAVELAVCAAAGASGRWPRIGSIATGVFLLALLALPTGGPRFSLLAMFIPIISLGARGRGGLRTAVTVWYLAVAGLLESGFDTNLAHFANSVAGWFFFALLAWVAGSSVRVLLMDRERAELVKAAALRAERRSIARDLHDTLAYSTTTMIMRAEQAKLRGQADPELAADLDYIINAGRNSIRDLRGILEVLRRNDPDARETAPRSPWRIAPLGDVIADRVAHLTGLGFRVTTLIEEDWSRLPDSVKETLSKVVVEATANMAKHAAHSEPCSIMIETDPNEVTAVFVNRVGSGSGGGPQQNHLGLVGLRERVETLGGSLRVTSTSPTWVLEARLPIGG